MPARPVQRQLAPSPRTHVRGVRRGKRRAQGWGGADELRQCGELRRGSRLFCAAPKACGAPARDSTPCPQRSCAHGVWSPGSVCGWWRRPPPPASSSARRASVTSGAAPPPPDAPWRMEAGCSLFHRVVVAVASLNCLLPSVVLSSLHLGGRANCSFQLSIIRACYLCQRALETVSHAQPSFGRTEPLVGAPTCHANPNSNQNNKL